MVSPIKLTISDKIAKKHLNFYLTSYVNSHIKFSKSEWMNYVLKE
jgi:hypothetical protein